MKKFFRMLGSFLHFLFGGSLDKWVVDNVTPAIEFVQQLKKAIDSKFVNVLTAIIPGHWDDDLKAFFSENLGRALNILAVTNDIASEPDLTNQLLKLLEYLKGASPDMRAAVFQKLAVIMARLRNDGNDTVRGHAIDLLVQAQYSKLAENVEASDLENVTVDDDSETPVAAIGTDTKEGAAAGPTVQATDNGTGQKDGTEGAATE